MGFNSGFKGLNMSLIFCIPFSLLLKFSTIPPLFYCNMGNYSSFSLCLVKFLLLQKLYITPTHISATLFMVLLIGAACFELSNEESKFLNS